MRALPPGHSPEQGRACPLLKLSDALGKTGIARLDHQHRLAEAAPEVTLEAAPAEAPGKIGQGHRGVLAAQHLLAVGDLQVVDVGRQQTVGEHLPPRQSCAAIAVEQHVEIHQAT